MMLRIWTYIQSRLVRDERGATAMEYGLVAGLISLTILLSLSRMGTWLNNVFTAAGNKLG